MILALAWLAAGRRFTLLLDGLGAVGAKTLAVSPLRYDGGGFRIGRVSLTFGGLDNLRGPQTLTTDSTNRVVFGDGTQFFTLGPRTNPLDPAGRPDIEFVPDAGDQVTFTTHTSLVSWPTPFEFHMMGGPSPWWKRYVYYRLSWKKPSHATLQMVWRYEQRYLSAKGWTDPFMMWNYQTGLISTSIAPPR